MMMMMIIIIIIWPVTRDYDDNNNNIKAQQSLVRSGQALKVPGSCSSQISSQSAHEGGKVISPTHRPP